MKFLRLFSCTQNEEVKCDMKRYSKWATTGEVLIIVGILAGCGSVPVPNVTTTKTSSTAASNNSSKATTLNNSVGLSQTQTWAGPTDSTQTGRNTSSPVSKSMKTLTNRLFT